LVPKNSRYLTYSAWCLFKLGGDDAEQVARAKAVLISALRIDKRNDRALYFLGCLYEDGGHAGRAKECWSKALKVNSSNFDAQAALRRTIE
jgi:cytochrome c-type biogenesis protein CcmH/NrfG